MKLEEIKTENDARQELVKTIVKIVQIGETNDIEEMEKESIFYRNLRNYVKRKFSVDTSPYDNVAKLVTPLMY